MEDALEKANEIAANLGLDVHYFQQKDIIQLLINPFHNVWTIVYQNRNDPYSAPAIFSCLADTNLESKVLEGTDWVRNADAFNPGFCITNTDTHYETGRDNGFDFLVKTMYFHSLEDEQIHINQEFVFLFELFHGEDGCYYAVDECGRKDKVIDVGKGLVRFKTAYLMRYIAAKQMLYVQFINSCRSSISNYPMHMELIGNEDHRSDCYRYQVLYQSTEEHDCLFSALYAHSFVRPNSVEMCRIWPYNKEMDDRFAKFIIRELPDGNYIRFSCNPNKLRNYFGANPNAPCYLTPVYFKPSVLDRYRNDPHFEVTERRLSCGTQWSIEIDNVIPSRVMVYLGDLGRDLPESERAHFLDYEIPPTEQHVSKTAFAQDFLCSYDAPMGPISMFFAEREKLNDIWTTKFGRSLYRPFHTDEKDIEKLIRIPSGNGRQEFDTVILNLTKCCIDYIDESTLISTGENRGIGKLEATLHELGIYTNLTPLRDLQKVRSACMAHAKGKKYEKLKDNLITGNCSNDISRLIERLTSMMSDLSSELEGLSTDNGIPIQPQDEHGQK